MPPIKPPTIYTNIDVLKSKLHKYEPVPIAKRIGIDTTVVIALDKIEFDPTLPILKEKHLNKFQSNKQTERATPTRTPDRNVKHKNKQQVSQKTTDRVLRDERVPRNSQVKESRKKQKSQYEPERRAILLSDDDDETPIRMPHDSHEAQNDSESIPNEAHSHVRDTLSPDRNGQREDDMEQDGRTRSQDNLEQPEVIECDDVEDENDIDGVACQSDIDQLILTGPEEDEFRQYSDDDEENETIMSRNLKKIRTDPPPRSTQFVQQSSNPFPPRPMHQQQQPQQHQPPPQQHQQRPTTSTTNATANTPPNISESIHLKSSPKAVPPEPELQVADLDRQLDLKNTKLVLNELNRRKQAFKADEAARSTLKKAVFSCIERDDTFMLLEFLGLVFEYNYLCDTQFWDELIRKLKRKDNPHARCDLKFKCDVEPRLVLHNYRLTVKRIAENFEGTNPTLSLPWNVFCYLRDSIQKSPSCSVDGTPMEIPIFGTGLTPKIKTGLQENSETKGDRNVSFYQDTDGSRKFKVKIPKCEPKYSAQFIM